MSHLNVREAHAGEDPLITLLPCVPKDVKEDTAPLAALLLGG